MRFLLLKYENENAFFGENPYEYAIKKVSNEKTALNDNIIIPSMTEAHEKQMIFLGTHYLAIPIIKKVEKQEDLEEKDEDEDEASDLDSEEDEEHDTGFSIHRLNDGSRICYLPNNGDFDFIKNSTQLIEESPQITGILDKKTG